SICLGIPRKPSSSMESSNLGSRSCTNRFPPKHSDRRSVRCSSGSPPPALALTDHSGRNQVAGSRQTCRKLALVSVALHALNPRALSPTRLFIRVDAKRHLADQL